MSSNLVEAKKSYEDRFKSFKLTSHKIRRDRGDPIQFYKIVHGLEEIEWVNEPRRLEYDANNLPSLRRNKLHYYRESKANLVRDNFFINRVIPLWNELPGRVREAPSLDAFKAGVDSLTKFSVNGCHGSN